MSLQESRIQRIYSRNHCQVARFAIGQNMLVSVGKVRDGCQHSLLYRQVVGDVGRPRQEECLNRTPPSKCVLISAQRILDDRAVDISSCSSHDARSTAHFSVQSCALDTEQYTLRILCKQVPIWALFSFFLVSVYSFFAIFPCFPFCFLLFSLCFPFFFPQI